VAHDQTVTSTGQVLGTAAYIAPEQALGEPATAASDRYALAIVAYELLTGRRPFEGEHFAAQARAHIEDDPTPPSEWAPGLGRDVDAVLLRGMAKDPADRYPSSAAFVDALDQALHEDPTTVTRPMPATGRFRRAGAPVAVPASAAASRRTPPPRTPPPPAPRRGGSGRRLAPLAVVLAALLLAGVVIAATTGGGDSGGDQATTPRSSKAKKQDTSPTKTQPQQPAQSTPAPVPSGQPDLGKASQLNAQGYAMQGSDPAGAVPILQQAVAACGGAATPTDPCAFALYNLGVALVDSGHPADAIPVLEKRLQNPNQQGAVQAELDKARAMVSGEGDSGDSGGGKAKGKKKND
jgi:serine/threonine protein kinase